MRRKLVDTLLPMFSEIETPRLSLRSLTPSDAQRIFEYRSHPDVTRFQSWGSESVAAIQSFLQAQAEADPAVPGSWYQVGIFLLKEGALVGDCGFRILASDSRQAEVGIALTPEFQGQGYAAEALSALIDYLLLALGKHRVFGSVDPRNLRCVRLLQRVGMRKEGHFVQSLWFRGEWVDDLIFAVLASEWKIRRSKPDLCE